MLTLYRDTPQSERAGFSGPALQSPVLASFQPLRGVASFLKE